jgi:glycosyltransferase involved in cell wall biosynthesis
MLVHNEDLFIKQAIINIFEFCDRVIIADHLSTDQTEQRVRELSHNHGKIDYHRIQHARESHNFITEYAGRNNWIFAVDGDEIYDPAGLKTLRSRLEAGEYAHWWVIFGNVLNCVEIDWTKKTAQGYLSPPCRSMTKLYNFNLIESWTDVPIERLHGGKVLFREDYSEDLRLNLNSQASWEDSIFRCLHMCFLRRSSLEVQESSNNKYAKKTPAELADYENKNILMKFIYRSFVKKSRWKRDKYARGPLVMKDISSFLVYTG